MMMKHCKKIVTAVYLACDEGPAKDISEHVQWLIGECERLQKLADSQIAYATRLECAIADAKYVFAGSRAIEGQSDEELDKREACIMRFLEISPKESV